MSAFKVMIFTFYIGFIFLKNTENNTGQLETNRPKNVLKISADSKKEGKPKLLLEVDESFINQYDKFSELINDPNKEPKNLDIKLTKYEARFFEIIYILSTGKPIKRIKASKIAGTLNLLNKYGLKREYKTDIYMKIIYSSIFHRNIIENIKIIEKFITQRCKKEHTREKDIIDPQFWIIFLGEILGTVNGSVILNNNTLEISSRQSENYNMTDEMCIGDISAIKIDVAIIKIIRKLRNQIKTFKGLRFGIQRICACLPTPHKIHKLILHGDVSEENQSLLQQIFDKCVLSVDVLEIDRLSYSPIKGSLFPEKNFVTFLEKFGGEKITSLGLAMFSNSKMEEYIFILRQNLVRNILKSLTLLPNTKITKYGARKITKLHFLEEMKIINCKIKPDVLEVLFSSAKLQQSIKILSLCGLKLTHKHVLLIKNFRCLEKLTIFDCDMQQRSYNEIRDMPSFNTRRTISIYI